MIRESEYEASDVVPGLGPNIRHPLSVFPSLHRVLRDQFPGFVSTTKVLRLPAAHLAALRFLRLAIPRAFTRCVRSLADECTAKAWSWSPGISSREFAEETAGSPKVPGEPQCSVCHVLVTPAGLLAPDHKVQQRGPWSSEGRGSHDSLFRRSIAWLSDSLSTLRRAGYPTPRKTRFPLLVRLYGTGFSPARFR